MFYHIVGGGNYWRRFPWIWFESLFWNKNPNAAVCLQFTGMCFCERLSALVDPLYLSISLFFSDAIVFGLLQIGLPFYSWQTSFSQHHCFCRQLQNIVLKDNWMTYYSQGSKAGCWKRNGLIGTITNIITFSNARIQFFSGWFVVSLGVENQMCLSIS